MARLHGRGHVAPWFRVPDKTAVSVEHPCVVMNVDKAIEMLGGPSAIPPIFEKDTEKPMSLTFHPDDAASRPFLSFNTNSNNVLLKITVPKRTGRKRKRGSTQPFTHDNDDSSPRKDARYLIRSLSDNQSSSDVEPVATVASTHLWRSMPDFVYSTDSSPFLNDFRSKILPKSYPLLKEYSLNLNPGPSASSTEVIPPPILSHYSVPLNYAYRQNPAVRTITDPITGTKRLLNTQAAMKVHTWQVQHDTPIYPTAVPAAAIPLAAQPANFQHLVTILTQLFHSRPIWTKRAFLNHLPINSPIFLARYAVSYVAFAIRSGPWRDTYCRLGVDPRSSPEYRKYQTALIQLVTSRGTRASANPKVITNPKSNTTITPNSIAYARTWSRSPDRNSHIFTGTGTIPPDGKAWQLCDLHESLLQNLVNIPDLHIRPVCSPRYFGWYPNGTHCKIRILLKTKVDAMMAGVTLPSLGLTDEKVARFANLPEEWLPERAISRGGGEVDPTVAYLSKDNALRRELVWASAYRSICRAREGEVPSVSGRLSKSVPATRASFRPSESGDGEDLDEMMLEDEGVLGVADGSPDDQDALEGFADPEEGEGDGEGDEVDVNEAENRGQSTNMEEMGSEDEGEGDEDENENEELGETG